MEVIARIPAHFKAEFEAERREKLATSVFVVTIIALLMYPFSTAMDYFSYYEYYRSLSVTRFSTTGALAGLLALLYLFRRTGNGARFARLSIWIQIAVICTSLDLFALIPGGPESPYYAGITLYLTAILVAYPMSLVEMSLTVGFVILQFNAVNVLLDDNLVPGGYFNANYFYIGTVFIGLFWTAMSERLRVQEFVLRKSVEAEKARSDELLLNVLPSDVADELKEHGKVLAKHIESCSILFTDFVGFTKVSDKVSPDDIVRSLDEVFSRFDEIVTRLGLEKLKTIGDAYMAAAGVTDDQPDHFLRCLLAGLEMHRVIEEEGLASADGSPWRMRIGIHPGPVVAGVIGRKRFAFDLWGDTVNTASRLESQGRPRTVNVATDVYRLVDRFFEGVNRGFVPVRGKGHIAMTGITRLRPKYSADKDGRVPNDAFTRDSADWALKVARTETAPAVGPMYAEPTLPALDGTDSMSVLTELRDDDREVLERLARPVSFKTGQVLVEQGQVLGVMLLIARGTTAVRVTREGVNVEVGVLRPGDVIGEMSFVSWEPASATVVALEDVVAMRFDVSQMETIVDQHPRTGMRLFHSLADILARRVRETNTRLLECGARAEALTGERFVRRTAGVSVVPSRLEQAVRVFKRGMDELDRSGSAPDEDGATEVSKACRNLIELAATSAAESDREGGDGIEAYFLRETFPFFMRSSLIERMYSKPMDGPWDHVTSDSIFSGKPSGYGTVGFLIDGWFQNWKIAGTLRSCQREVSNAIVEAYRDRPADGDLYRITVMRGGSAPELFDALGRIDNPDDVEVVCTDEDLAALSTLGKRAVKQGLSDRFTFVSRDLLDSGIRRKRLAAQHFTYMPVMARQMDDNQLVLTLDSVHAGLAPGGMFVMGVMDLPEDADFVCRSVLDWNVPSFDSEKVLKLVAQSAFGRDLAECRVLGDSWGFLLIARKEG